MGRMQVMPGTARDPGFGIKPAKDDSPAELARVGREYRAAMQARYGGDHSKMWAAYNAGPGRVDRALSAGGNWLGRLPKETRDYVARNLAALAGR
jgi:soluble lytic murein transglycosylase-like protein